MSQALKNLFSGSKIPARLPQSVEIKPEITPLAKILVVGVGGGGCNALNCMADLADVTKIAANTDTQAQYHSKADVRINIGKTTTRGLGAGAMPEVGKKAAEESIEELRSVLEGTDMVFITCGLGGGTGTGAAPVIAGLAKEMGILTVGVVTKPFAFEGVRRLENAIKGHEELRSRVDTLITIPNDRILSIIDKKTPLTEAFLVVNDVLRQAIQGVTDLVTVHGMINVDFADVRTIMQNAGSALMGIGYGQGENRAVEAARAAIESPLLELSIQGAKGILFNITGGNDLSMFEVDEAAKVITEAADPNANIIFGAAINEKYTGEMKVTVIATGFNEEEQQRVQNISTSASMQRMGNTPTSSLKVSGMSKPSAAGVRKPEVDLEVPAFMRKSLHK